MRFTFDSNILIYADDIAEPDKQPFAKILLARAIGGDCFITQQALGEFINVGRRKRLPRIVDLLDEYRNGFFIVPTRFSQLLEGLALAERHRKQFWDMVIVRVAADAGAAVLISEDIGDGEIIAGVRIVDPFKPANAALIDALLTPSP